MSKFETAGRTKGGDASIWGWASDTSGPNTHMYRLIGVANRSVKLEGTDTVATESVTSTLNTKIIIIMNYDCVLTIIQKQIAD